MKLVELQSQEKEKQSLAMTRSDMQVMFFDLAREGNEKALKLCDEVAYDLAVMFSAIAHVVDPYVFVVGGGVMKGKDVFFDKMEAYYRTMIHKGMQTVEFKEAQLEEPGIVGAAMVLSLIGWFLVKEKALCAGRKGRAGKVQGLLSSVQREQADGGLLFERRLFRFYLVPYFCHACVLHKMGILHGSDHRRHKHGAVWCPQRHFFHDDAHTAPGWCSYWSSALEAL